MITVVARLRIATWPGSRRVLAPLFFAIGVLLAGAHDARADSATCAPVVELTGDARLVTEVSSQLAARGIAAKPSPGCPSVVVTLDQRDEVIIVDVRDVNGRTSRRTVAQPHEAASVIESWVRPLDGDLLAGIGVEAATTAGPLPQRQEAPAAVSARVSSDATIQNAVASVDTRPRDRFSVALTGDVALSASQTPMLGASATGCVRLSRVCLGATAHLWRLSNGSASDSEFLAAVELPLVVGRVAVIPGVALGAGDVAIAMTNGQSQNQDQNQLEDGWGFRAEGRVHATYPLSRRILVDAVAGVVAAPGPSGQSQNGVASSAVELAVQIGAGLRVGAW